MGKALTEKLWSMEDIYMDLADMAQDRGETVCQQSRCHGALISGGSGGLCLDN